MTLFFIDWVWEVQIVNTVSTLKIVLKFILVINQLDAQNLFYNKFISCLYMFRAPCAHRQEVEIVLYNTGLPPTGVMIPDAV